MDRREPEPKRPESNPTRMMIPIITEICRDSVAALAAGRLGRTAQALRSGLRLGGSVSESRDPSPPLTRAP